MFPEVSTLDVTDEPFRRIPFLSSGTGAGKGGCPHFYSTSLVNSFCNLLCHTTAGSKTPRPRQDQQLLATGDRIGLTRLR